MHIFPVRKTVQRSVFCFPFPAGVDAHTELAVFGIRQVVVHIAADWGVTRGIVHHECALISSWQSVGLVILYGKCRPVDASVQTKGKVVSFLVKLMLIVQPERQKQVIALRFVEDGILVFARLVKKLYAFALLSHLRFPE